MNWDSLSTLSGYKTTSGAGSLCDDGDSLTAYDIAQRTYWSEPFKITVEKGFALVVFRSTAVRVPLSEDLLCRLRGCWPICRRSTFSDRTWQGFSIDGECSTVQSR